ncbi:MAG: hydroxylamine reductase [Gammaproteobacteria bacterium]|nr:hydroxylamine reductase [Gammaproteobacteria bacterium]
MEQRVSWKRVAELVLPVLSLCCCAAAVADIPKETYQALGVTKNDPPKKLFDALEKRYHDPAQGAGKGKYGHLWDPIPMSRYFDPHTFYEPPASVKEVAERKECVECHSDETPGWVRSWKKSAHANLDGIRKLPKGDPLYYRKEKLEQVENNLRSMGKLGETEQLAEVGCIDCHVDINTNKKADHTADLRLPDAAVCGTCHLEEFAERESERDTQIWPNDEWPRGRPSHALDYRANVETGIWAGMPQREIAEGCTGCHYNQNKCDGCHTRHEFSLVEARKPEACATCHRGIDHNNYENYMVSKHGAVYTSLGDTWNWQLPLKDAFTKGGQTAPTCASCHMEYKGKFSHNVVRKVRWANYPSVPGVAEGINGEWSKQRLEAWVETCTQCHSERLTRSYLELMDKATLAGLEKYKEAHEVVVKLYEDGLLPGQKTNRPAPPEPEKDAPVSFFQLFWTKGNNPTAIEFEAMEMGENDLVKLHVAAAHVNPGNWTYTEGWEPMNRAYAKIMQENTQIREMATVKQKLAQLDSSPVFGLIDGVQTDARQASLGGLGGVMLLAGSLGLLRSRRRRDSGRDAGDHR